MLRFVLALLVAAAVFAPAVCQSSLRGVVRDGSGKGVPFANVLLLDARDSSLVKGAVSTEAGVYVLENLKPSRYLMAATAVGFQKIHSAPFHTAETGGTAPTLILAEAAGTLGEVTVSAQKPLFEQQMDKLVVNVQGSITAAGGTALDVLERSPGVTVNRQNNALSLAGKSGVMVMINGKLNRLPMDAVVQMLGGMSASNVEKIELITNPSARYDAEGDAGIINLVLKKNTAFGTNGTYSLTAGFGYYERPAASLGINHRTRRLSLFGDYSYTREHAWMQLALFRTTRNLGVVTETDIVRDANTRRDNQNARLGFDYSLGPRTTLGGLLTGFSNRLGLTAPNHTDLRQDGRLATQIDMADREVNHWRHGMGNLNLRQGFKKGQELSLDADFLLYHNRNPHDYTTTYRYLSEVRTTDEALTVRKTTPIRMGVFKADYTATVGKTRLEFGAKSTLMRLTNDVTVARNGEPDRELSQYYTLRDDINAAYANLSRPLGSKIKLQAGLRYEHTHTNISTPEQAGLVRRRYGSLFPSVFLSKDFSQKSGLQLSYSRRIQRPAYTILAPFVFFTDPNTYTTGNPNLLPTFTDALRGTYRFRESYLLTLAYSHDRNAIDRFRIQTDSVRNRSSAVPQNIRSLNTLSLTFSFPLHLAPWWTVQNNLLGVAQQANTTAEGKAIVVRQVNANLNTSHTFKLPRSFTGELVAFYQSPSLFGIARVQALGSVNVGLAKKLPRDGGSLKFSVTDLFWTNRLRVINDNAALNLRGGWTYLGEPRVVRLTYSRAFGSQTVKAANRRATGSDEERGRVQTN